MRVPRLYFEAELQLGSRTQLSKEQAHYLGRVLRLKAGRELVLFNGNGAEYLCELESIDAKQGAVLVKKQQDVQTESPIEICLALGLSKGDRFDWAIQKATELGVSSIQPLFCVRGEVRLSQERLAKKATHWSGILRSASEQSGRTRLPQLKPPLNLDEFLERNGDTPATGFVLDPLAKVSLSELVLEIQARRPKQNPASAFVLLIGPEGGLEPAEVAAAEQAGYQRVAMGPRVLRTETAPIAALTLLQAGFGDI